MDHSWSGLFQANSAGTTSLFVASGVQERRGGDRWRQTGHPRLGTVRHSNRRAIKWAYGCGHRLGRSSCVRRHIAGVMVSGRGCRCRLSLSGVRRGGTSGVRQGRAALGRRWFGSTLQAATWRLYVALWRYGTNDFDRQQDFVMSSTTGMTRYRARVSFQAAEYCPTCGASVTTTWGLAASMGRRTAASVLSTTRVGTVRGFRQQQLQTCDG